MIEIYLLEQLAAFRKYGTLLSASEHLHLTQPTLTRSMQKIEELAGVPLFIREHKRLSLNENGLLLADYAQRILDEECEMLDRVRTLDRSHCTVTIGSSGPGPLLTMVPLFHEIFPEAKTASELKSEDKLIKGLMDDEYQLIILDHELDSEDLTQFYCGSESLFLEIMPDHPAAGLKSISFKEADGMSFLIHTEIGIWDQLVRKYMPNSTFLMQSDMDSLKQVAASSTLPSFQTDLGIEDAGLRGSRIAVPFSDPEACVRFYCILKKKNRIKYNAFIEAIRENHSKD